MQYLWKQYQYFYQLDLDKNSNEVAKIVKKQTVGSEHWFNMIYEISLV